MSFVTENPPDGTPTWIDLGIPDLERATAFYASVFDFTLDGNPDLPDFDFTFLRRPDGHEIGGVMGVPGAPSSGWSTLFEVADTDAAVARLDEGGAEIEASARVTPWRSRNARLRGPAGLQLTLFQELGPTD